MIQISFNNNEIELLNYLRYHYPHPFVQRKMEVLWLKGQNLPHKQIAQLAGVSPNTVTSYICDYQEGGIEELKEINFYKPNSELSNHTSTIEAYFKEHLPASLKEAANKIEELTGLKRSETQIGKFLKSIGMKCRKVGMIPSKADIEEQEKFKKEKLEPRLEGAKQGERKVYFVDAAHFVLSPFLGYLWSFTRIFIKAPAGRKRFNVLGALDAITHELITVTNDSYINAKSVCKLLWQIYELNLGIPITLILDNAKYQKCLIVQELAQFLNIELLYLTPYSPNLNIIERLWKYVKKQCLYSKYYSDFDLFKNAIIDCLDQTHTTHKQDLDTLLALKFQTFKKSQFINT
jgi:transposase